MRKSELTYLLSKAKAATPGPWDYYLEQGYEGHGVIVTYDEDEKGMRKLKDSVFKRLYTSEENKEFVAAANPEAITRLAESYLKALELINKIANKYYCRETGRYEDDSREFLRKIGEV